MSDFWTAGGVLLVLLVSAAAGMLVQSFTADAHKSREMRELSQVVTSMLVTLAALVLGLLTSSVVQSYNRAGNNLGDYAVELIRLSQTLREFGPDADPARTLLRGYVANAIATTWPDEPKPAGIDATPDASLPAPSPAAAPHSSLESVALGTLLDRVGRTIRSLPTTDPDHASLAATANRQFEQLLQDRWTLLEQAHSSIPLPFFRVLVFWLMIVFTSLGLIAPRNLLAGVMLLLAALAIASVIFAIMEMDTPFSGLIAVPSAPMRDALAHLSQ